MIHMVMARVLVLGEGMVVMTISHQEILLTTIIINGALVLVLALAITVADRNPVRVPTTITLMEQEASMKVNWTP